MAETRVAREPIWLRDTILLIYLAPVTVIAHVATAGRYGFNRDERATRR